MKIIPAKKPGYSLLCSKNIDTLPLGDQLRVMRLRTGLTIEQAAQAIGIERRRTMNYELGKVKRMKAEVVSGLLELYKESFANVVIVCSHQLIKVWVAVY